MKTLRLAESIYDFILQICCIKVKYSNESNVPVKTNERLTESVIFLYRAAGIMISPLCQINTAVRTLLFTIDR